MIKDDEDGVGKITRNSKEREKQKGILLGSQHAEAVTAGNAAGYKYMHSPPGRGTTALAGTLCTEEARLWRESLDHD